MRYIVDKSLKDVVPALEEIFGAKINQRLMAPFSIKVLNRYGTYILIECQNWGIRKINDDHPEQTSVTFYHCSDFVSKYHPESALSIEQILDPNFEYLSDETKKKIIFNLDLFGIGTGSDSVTYYPPIK